MGGGAFHRNTMDFALEEKCCLYRENATWVGGGSPFEEMKAPFKRVGIFYINSPARLTGLIF